MTEQAQLKPSDVTVRSNWLNLRGHTMAADVLTLPEAQTVVSSELVHQILVDGRLNVLNGILDFRARGATDEPSIFVAHLGTDAQTERRDGAVFTDKGYDNGGTIESLAEIREPFHPYWHAIYDAGFRPEVRRMTGKDMNGPWMLLRRPTLTQVSEEWLAYKNGPKLSSYIDMVLADPTRKVQELPDEKKRPLLDAARSDQMKRIDAVSDGVEKAGGPVEIQMTTRSVLEIGALISIAALKQTIEYKGGIKGDIDDALQYAFNSEFIPESVVLAIENAAYTA